MFASCVSRTLRSCSDRNVPLRTTRTLFLIRVCFYLLKFFLPSLCERVPLATQHSFLCDSLNSQLFWAKGHQPRTNLGNIPVHLHWEGTGIDFPTCNGKHTVVDKPLVIHPLVNICVAAVKFGQIWGPGRACAVMRTVPCVSSSPTEITHWSLSDLRTPLESVPMLGNDLWWVGYVHSGEMHWNEWEFEYWEFLSIYDN